MSDALSLYAPEVQQLWRNQDTCDLNYLMWFHHLPWNYKLSTGNILWDELMLRYYAGVDEVQGFIDRWATLQSEVDPEIFNNVSSRLLIQKKEALWWRDACYLYFREFSKLPLPAGLIPPERTLEDVKALESLL